MSSEELTCSVCERPGNDCICELAVNKEDYDAVVHLAKKLLKGANLCMEEQALIQPFFSIVKDNAAIIGKLNLFDE